jgi:hypothetical protein
MQCPQGDGELQSHTTHGEQNLTVIYSTCPTCHGYWMESFAANFIKITWETHAKKPIVSEKKILCPLCKQQLICATGDNIPDHVFVYSCPNHHGYFFPASELASFKRAQKTKIEYHKLWNLPLASVGSVLLAVFVGFVVIHGISINQQTTIQARQLLTGHHAYIVSETHEALLSAQTSSETTLIAHVSNGLEKAMTRTDKNTHILLIPNISPGTYRYYFTFVVNGETIRSETFTFIMP